MTEEGTLNFLSKGDFDEVTAVGLVGQESFIELYERLFQSRKGQDVVRVLVNILDFQGQLSFDTFTLILHYADECGIGHIDMTVVTLDPARPLIGELLEALADRFTVTVKITFLQQIPDDTADWQTA